MPFALLIIGLVLIVAAVRNTQDELITIVQGDFQGTGNFIYWVAAILAIGAIGYVKKFKPLSDGFLVLVLLVLVLSKGNPKAPGGGFFQQFTAALKGTQTGAGGGSTTTITGGVNQTGTLTPVDTSGLPTVTAPTISLGGTRV